MILVTGANGMLGSSVRSVFNNREMLCTDIDTLDISNRDNVFDIFSDNKPDIVLHLAAETDVDKCQAYPEHAFKVNVTGTRNIAEASKLHNSVLVYISTAAVFNGTKGHSYSELDKPNPLSVYSKSKYKGEQAVQATLTRYYIFRAGWMIGGGPEKDKKFVGKIIKLCTSQTRIEAVNDKTGSPTFTDDFLRGVLRILKANSFGLYHLVNEGSCTRFDIAREIAGHINPSVEVVPVSSARFKLLAPRPDSEVLINKRLEREGLDIMPYWKESLKRYLNKWKNTSDEI